jgi:hypothetical protein
MLLIVLREGYIEENSEIHQIVGFAVYTVQTEPDPESNPDLLARGMSPGIRIRTKMSRIPMQHYLIQLPGLLVQSMCHTEKSFGQIGLANLRPLLYFPWAKDMNC